MSLPTLARICLICTFFEDGIRMFPEWNMQRAYIDISWGCGKTLATFFVILNLFGQLGGCLMVLVRFKVDAACAVLFAMVVMQTVAYGTLWDLQLQVRNLALVGALLLVLAESRQESKSLFAGVPTLGYNKPKNCFQLTGRILLVFMFATLIRLEFSLMQVLQNVVGSALMLLVTVGYKTKLSALIMVIWLTALNLYSNCWWTIRSYNAEFVKYDFFLTISVIGGLMMVVCIGPGGVSMDENKKKW